MTELSDTAIAQFGIEPSDAEEIPDPIAEAANYIASRTGLLGDYNDGHVTFAEGGQTILWYARGRLASNHDDLLQWVQEHPDLTLGQVGLRTHPETGEENPYLEIHERDRWVSDGRLEDWGFDTDDPRHAEIKLTPEGLSASLYSGTVLVDEMWSTWGELAPDHEIPPVDEEKRFSLGVSDDE